MCVCVCVRVGVFVRVYVTHGGGYRVTSALVFTLLREDM